MTAERHTYEYDVDVNAETAPAHIVRMVGLNKRVLEIGCGPGSITKVLAQQNHCLMTGIELDPSAIEKVTPYCVQVIPADLNSSEWPSLLDGAERFDVVVAADVLEHLYDPWISLQRMVPLINADGYLVVSLPHVGHAAVMSCLINGDFAYGDWGLLDRTHIRFFGLRNIEALFAQAALKIIEAKYVITPPEATEFAAGWSRLSSAAQDVLMSTGHSEVYQVVVKAVPMDFPGDAISLLPPKREPRVLAANALEEAGGNALESAAQATYSHGSLTDANDAETIATAIPETTGNQRLASDDQPVPRLIAFYLTQFHPTPENDLWWGKGFTEWTNVTKAEPLFEDHRQPHLPSDFGFYDLRVRETRRDQIEMAKQYGIDGFCYHYYWFSGKRILNTPLDDMLADPQSDMPFCLCWANENWTRRWDGAEDEVLIAQQYLADDDLNFVKSLVPFLSDRRYIRVDGKPYLIVYRPQHLPDARKSVGIWRDYCRSIGLGEIHVACALTHHNTDYEQFGLDSGVEFPPHNLQIVNVNQQVKFHDDFHGYVMQFEYIAQSYLGRSYGAGWVSKCVFPSWDNTARTKDRALVVLNGVPDNYEYWLASTIDMVRQSGRRDELIFINAWNEWAEGCHLEPDRWFGHGFLQATLNAKNGLRRFAAFPETALPHKDEVPHRTFWKDFRDVVGFHSRLRLENLGPAMNRRPWLRMMALPFVKTARALGARI